MEEVLFLTGAMHDVSRARHFVRETLSGWGLPGCAPDAELVTSELLTNALSYGRAPFRLVVRNLAVAVRIEAWDGSPDILPVRANGDVDRPAGRGLQLTDELAESWGVEFSADGRRKGVWVELVVDPGRPLGAGPSSRE